MIEAGDTLLEVDHRPTNSSKDALALFKTLKVGDIIGLLVFKGNGSAQDGESPAKHLQMTVGHRKLDARRLTLLQQHANGVLSSGDLDTWREEGDIWAKVK